MLYRAEKFEPLTETPWDEARVRARIAAIVADAESTYSPDALWPADEWDGWKSALPLKNLYVGAAGVVWGLDALRRRGHGDGALDLPAAAARALELFREEPDFIQDDSFPLPSPRESALFVGETGILTVAWLLTRKDELADDLHARVVANVDNEAEELFWGAPGTLLVARAMHAWTGEERWADARDATANALMERRDADGLWTQRLYGGERRGLSVPHGLVGNVLALGGGDTLERDTNAILARTAIFEDGAANWAHPLGAPLETAEGEIRLQWCAGAPGTVIGAARYLDEELVLAGAETIWRAGPHGMEKGPSICHGTAGNGYAFLKTFERTQDERWLDRARRFAAHALEQVERRGRGRYSLWTGDVGIALYAADCIDARAEYPVLDSWSTEPAGTSPSG